MSRLSWVIAIAASAVLITACVEEKPVVSIDQAKQITAQFQSDKFVPPPRTITDVTEILNQYKPDAAQLSALKASVAAQPPAGAPPRALYEFYLNRGRAAGELGMFAQQLSDLQEAVNIGDQNKADNYRALQELRGAQSNVGNYRSAMEYAQRQLKAQTAPGGALTAYAQLAVQQRKVGDLAGAKLSIERAEGIFQNLTGPTANAMGANWKSSIVNAKAYLAGSNGFYAEAERNAREAYELVQRALKDYPEAKKWVPDLSITQIQGLVAAGPAGIGDVLLVAGRPVEAEAEYRQALLSALKLWGRDNPRTIRVIRYLARSLYQQGRYSEARQLNDLTLDFYEQLGLTSGSAAVAEGYVMRAKTLSATGNTADAFKALRQASAVFADDAAQRFLYVEGSPDYVLALTRSDRAAEVLPIAERVVADRQQRLGNNSYEAAEARGALAVALAKSGKPEPAMAEFRAAVPLLLQTSRQADDGAGGVDRDRRLQRIMETYIDLISRAGAGNVTGADAAEAFRIADSIRARGVQRALAASAARLDIKDPALADLARREQDAQKQIAARFGVLTAALASPPDQQDRAALTALRTDIDNLRNARAALRGEIERRFPDYANLIDPRPSTVADVQASMRPGEAMLATYVGQEHTFVWAVPASGPVVFASVDMDTQQAATMVGDLRKALDPNAATLGDIPEFDVKLAYRLYSQLIAPVAEGLKGATSLLVVPDKALGQLPFGLLVTADTNLRPDTGALFANYRQVPFLVRQASITQLPYVAALATLRRLPAASAGRRAFAGFGDPWFSQEQAREAEAEKPQPVQVAALATRGRPLLRRSAPKTEGVDSAELAQLPRLPDTADEVRAIAVALKADPVQDVFLGRRASEKMVKTTNLADRRVVLFATHGLVPGDLNGLTQPALALSAPQVADGDGDGLLTMDKILGLRLNADWVVLSACNTAASDGNGAEAASGLGLAFFYAGTRALLLSNWPVETTSARTLTTDLFRRQTENAELGRARAMQQAMLALIDGDGYVEGGKIVYSYAHPIFWAPFSVVGDGGG